MLWIRVFDLPLLAGIEHVGRMVGESLGGFIDIDMVDGEVIWNEFTRIRVKLVITKPMARRKKIRFSDADAVLGSIIL